MRKQPRTPVASAEPVSVRHSSKKTEHYTPRDIVEAARTVLGGIDFDPASDEQGNSIVKAKKFLTKADNALRFAHKWNGKVFLNPPGGVIRGNVSQQGAFWRKLATQYQNNYVTQAIFVGFSIEILQISQNGHPSALDFPVCVFAKRIRFLGEDGQPGNQPTHGNVVVFLPPKHASGRAAGVKLFTEQFEQFGGIMLPVRRHS